MPMLMCVRIDASPADLISNILYTLELCLSSDTHTKNWPRTKRCLWTIRNETMATNYALLANWKNVLIIAMSLRLLMDFYFVSMLFSGHLSHHARVLWLWLWLYKVITKAAYNFCILSVWLGGAGEVMRNWKKNQFWFSILQISIRRKRKEKLL